MTMSMKYTLAYCSKHRAASLCLLASRSFSENITHTRWLTDIHNLSKKHGYTTEMSTCQVSGKQCQLFWWQWDVCCHGEGMSPACTADEGLQGTGRLSTSP